MKKLFPFLLIVLLGFVFYAHIAVTNSTTSLDSESLVVRAPVFVLSNVPFDVQATALMANGMVDTLNHSSVQISGCTIAGLEPMAGSSDYSVSFERGQLRLKQVVLADGGSGEIGVSGASETLIVKPLILPGIVKLLPPVLAIILALLARQVLVALFCGIWLGATLVTGLDPLAGFLRALDTYIINSLANPDHVAIVIFSMTLGGMVGIISKSGGTTGIIEKITKYANHPRGGNSRVGRWAYLSFSMITPTRSSSATRCARSPTN